MTQRSRVGLTSVCVHRVDVGAVSERHLVPANRTRLRAAMALDVGVIELVILSLNRRSLGLPVSCVAEDGLPEHRRVG